MSDVMIAILGIAAMMFAVTYIFFASARMRNDRRRQDKLSIAFDRAQSIRTRGTSPQGSPRGLYAEPVWSIRRDRGGK